MVAIGPNTIAAPIAKCSAETATGAHLVFADGHTAFIRESVSRAVLRAMSTRDQGKYELAIEDGITDAEN